MWNRRGLFFGLIIGGVLGIFVNVLGLLLTLGYDTLTLWLFSALFVGLCAGLYRPDVGLGAGVGFGLGLTTVGLIDIIAGLNTDGMDILTFWWIFVTMVGMIGAGLSSLLKLLCNFFQRDNRLNRFINGNKQ